MAFNTRIAAVAVAAAVAGGGAAFLVAPAVSSAQETDAPSDTTDDSQVPGGELPEGETPEGMPGAPSGSESGAACAPGPGGPEGRGPGLEAAAEAIGIDVDALMTELQGGTTLAEVAAANGVSVDDVVAAMVADGEEHLVAAVEEGRLSQEEADEIAAELPERIAEMVENGPPAGGPQGGMPGGPQGPTGPDRDSDSSSSQPAALTL